MLRLKEKMIFRKRSACHFICHLKISAVFERDWEWLCFLHLKKKKNALHVSRLAFLYRAPPKVLCRSIYHVIISTTQDVCQTEL